MENQELLEEGIEKEENMEAEETHDMNCPKGLWIVSHQFPPRHQKKVGLKKYTGVRINQNFEEVLRPKCQEPLSGPSMLDLIFWWKGFYDMISDGLIVINMSKLLLCMKSLCRPMTKRWPMFAFVSNYTYFQNKS